MKKTKKYQQLEQTDFLETLAGIFTKNGVWFQTNVNSLNEFAGDLFDIVPLNFLLEKAENWIKSTDTVGIVIAMISLFLLPPHIAMALTLGLTWIFDSLRPTFYTTLFSNVNQFLGKDYIILTLAVIPLSWFGMNGQYFSLILGMILFLIFKFGWIRNLFEKIRKDTAIPMNDRILHMIINRYAIREGIGTTSTISIERRLLEALETSSKQRTNLFK